MDWKEWQRYTSKHGSKRYRIPLNFGKYTSIQLIPNDDFHEHYFNFIAYNEVQSKADVNGATLTDIRIYHPTVALQYTANTAHDEVERMKTDIPKITLKFNPQHYQKLYKRNPYRHGNKNEPSPSTKGTEEALQAMAEERKKK
ncbi:hypothetical protein Tco_1158337, partial [Tanacetum coccineum]